MNAKKYCEYFLEFLLCEESYCVCVKYVREIKDRIKVKPLPRLPEYVVGVTKYEEELVPVIDLRRYVGCQGKENPEGIFLEIEGHKVCLLVDKAFNIRKKEKGKIEEIPKEIRPMLKGCLIGALIEGEEIIPIFNPKEFLKIALKVKLRKCDNLLTNICILAPSFLTFHARKA